RKPRGPAPKNHPPPPPPAPAARTRPPPPDGAPPATPATLADCPVALSARPPRRRAARDPAAPGGAARRPTPAPRRPVPQRQRHGEPLAHPQPRLGHLPGLAEPPVDARRGAAPVASPLHPGQSRPLIRGPAGL